MRTETGRLKKLKRITVVIILAVTLVLCAIIVFLVVNSFRLDTDRYSRAVAIFEYEDSNIHEGIIKSDCEDIARLLENKQLHKGKDTCGFSDVISVVFKTENDERMTFCIARDTCGVIYIKELDRYIHLSNDEMKKLRSILDDYGMYFPCI